MYEAYAVSLSRDIDIARIAYIERAASAPIDGKTPLVFTIVPRFCNSTINIPLAAVSHVVRLIGGFCVAAQAQLPSVFDVKCIVQAIKVLQVRLIVEDASNGGVVAIDVLIAIKRHFPQAFHGLPLPCLLKMDNVAPLAVHWARAEISFTVARHLPEDFVGIVRKANTQRKPPIP